jgi:two-component system chemotaxis response regulator CheB
MPPNFTRQLVARLNNVSKLEVREAAEGDSIQAGRVLLAPGDQHLLLRQFGKVGLSKEPTESLHCPSVDVLMHSGAEIYVWFQL